MASFRVSFLVASIIVFDFAGEACAQSVTVTKAVQDACAWEYNKFCNQYGIGTQLLDMCFRQNADHMTKACVDALLRLAISPRNMLISRRNFWATRPARI